MEESFVSMLREKTEEADLDTILKTSFGGYTKQSVQEYLAHIRKQQQDLKQAYAAENLRTQNEREALLQELDSLRGKAQDSEDAPALREKLAALESDVNDAVERIAQDEKTLEEKDAQIEALKAEIAALREENGEKAVCISALSKKNASLSAELDSLRPQGEETPAAQEEEEDDIEARRSIQLKELFAQVELLQGELAARDRKLEERNARLESVLRSEENLYQVLQDSRAELQERRDQAEWMESENAEISLRLREQMERSLSLSRDLAKLKAANMSLLRRLEMAQSERRKNSSYTDELQNMGGIPYELPLVSEM